MAPRIAGIPTQTLFDPKENYPPGVLRYVTIGTDGAGVWDVGFFPECQEVVFAMQNRTSDSEQFRAEKLSGWDVSRNDRAEDSWSLDEISSEKKKWYKGKLMVEWDTQKCTLMKRDVGMIEEILEWQERDLRNMENEAEELLQRVSENEEMEEWVNTHTFTEEEVEFFEKEITDMNRHHMRASAGPPTGEYWMNVSYDPKTGLRDKNKRCGCWRYEEWCPEMGRLSLISLPEENGGFSTFNKEFVPFGIQWPKEIQEKTDGECGEKRFSGLKSCGRWMEWTMDNDGRFVTNGLVKEIRPFRVNEPIWGCIVATDYGDCVVGEYLVTKHGLKEGDEVKLLCRDNDVLQDWASPIKLCRVIRTGPGACEDFAPCGWY